MGERRETGYFQFFFYMQCNVHFIFSNWSFDLELVQLETLVHKLVTI